MGKNVLMCQDNGDRHAWVWHLGLSPRPPFGAILSRYKARCLKGAERDKEGKVVIIRSMGFENMSQGEDYG
jgi:hypothetical protein